MQPYEQLEQQFAEWNELDPAGMVACSSGTAALHLALEALQLEPRSEVLVPDFTMVACARAVSMAGLRPVFVDCDDRLTVTYQTLTDSGWGSLFDGRGAVMAVHVYGRRCPMDEVARFAGQHGALVVEDLAEAHGVRPHQTTDAACWSFYRNKIIAGEEGGAVWFRDPERAALARSLRTLGFTQAHDFQHYPRGHNYRLANCLAVRILDRLDQYRHNHCPLPDGSFGRLSDLRRMIEGWYEEECPAPWRMPARDVVWVYDLRIPGMTTETQDRLVSTLKAEGIEARHGFKPMTTQLEYRVRRPTEEERRTRTAWDEPMEDLRHAEGKAHVAAREVVYLPVVPGVTSQESCRHAFRVIRRALNYAGG